jgi:hypothetical protein
MGEWRTDLVPFIDTVEYMCPGSLRGTSILMEYIVEGVNVQRQSFNRRYGGGTPVVMPYYETEPMS